MAHVTDQLEHCVLPDGHDIDRTCVARTEEHECGQCHEDITDLVNAVENTDPWGKATGELFCNEECLSNASEAYWLARYADQ